MMKLLFFTKLIVPYNKLFNVFSVIWSCSLSLNLNMCKCIMKLGLLILCFVHDINCTFYELVVISNIVVFGFGIYALFTTLMSYSLTCVFSKSCSMEPARYNLMTDILLALPGDQV